MKSIKLILWFIGLIIMPFYSAVCQPKTLNQVNKNGMQISWQHKENRVYFEMSAPTNGWVTIGFNASKSISGAYLLMGHIINGEVKVVEHYTSSPGNYLPITKYEVQPRVEDIKGIQKAQQTTIQFSLPIKTNNEYQRNLSKGREYFMLIAYSLEDDFQHHSIMRTSVKIKL